MPSYFWIPDQPFNDLPSLPPSDFSENSISQENLKQTRVALAKLEGKTEGAGKHTFHHLLNPLLLAEALSSSEIENIKTTLESVLEYELEDEEELSADQKVLNYRRALMWGWKFIEEENHPITERLIKGLHERLLPLDKHQWRREQNRIVDHTTGNVRYTPPENAYIPQLLTQWENFVNTEDSLDPLIVAALSHYQFEAIHPFQDGNGRTGRMLLVLQLIKYGLLPGPFVHVSSFINTYRSRYYQLLREVTEQENWKEFVEFTLDAYKEQALQAHSTLSLLDEMQKDVTSSVREKASKIYSQDLIDKIFEFPVINPTRLGKELTIHRETASKYLKNLEQIGVLRSYKKGRQRLFVNDGALKVITGEQ